MTHAVHELAAMRRFWIGLRDTVFATGAITFVVAAARLTIRARSAEADLDAAISV
jgi:hypothetical protein